MNAKSDDEAVRLSSGEIADFTFTWKPNMDLPFDLTDRIHRQVVDRLGQTGSVSTPSPPVNTNRPSPTAMDLWMKGVTKPRATEKLAAFGDAVKNVGVKMQGTSPLVQSVDDATLAMSAMTETLQTMVAGRTTRVWRDGENDSVVMECEDHRVEISFALFQLLAPGLGVNPPEDEADWFEDSDSFGWNQGAHSHLVETLAGDGFTGNAFATHVLVHGILTSADLQLDFGHVVLQPSRRKMRMNPSTISYLASEEVGSVGVWPMVSHALLDEAIRGVEDFDIETLHVKLPIEITDSVAALDRQIIALTEALGNANDDDMPALIEGLNMTRHRISAMRRTTDDFDGRLGAIEDILRARFG